MTAINKKSSSTVLEKFERTMERWSDRNIAEMRNETIVERRKKIEKENKKFRIISHFPFIGRGNVHRDNVLSNEEIEKDLDKILK